MQICFKCGIEAKTLIKWGKHKGLHPTKIKKHHISYNPEIIVDCCQSCHNKIHQKLRKNKLCSLTVKEAHKLSSESSIKRNRAFNFSERMDKNVHLHEELRYNPDTGILSWYSCFHAVNEKSIYYLK